MKFLRNPAWLAVILSALAIPVSLALYFNGRPVKKLRVEILSNSPLVSIDTAMAKEMQVLYKGVPVQTLSLILLKFANAGTEPIKESDYSEPIRVLMSQGAAVGEVSVQETRPDGIQLAPTVNASNQVELARALLNPGDQAVLKILALNNDSTLKITARIVGIPTLDIQSVLGRNEGGGQISLSVLLGVLILVLVFVIGPLVMWQSRTVMNWRKKRFGFDPARYYYIHAQAGVLTLPASKDTGEALGKASMALAQVIRYLDQCFSWDITYLKRVEGDPLFSQVIHYERFKDVADKHKASIPK